MPTESLPIHAWMLPNDESTWSPQEAYIVEKNIAAHFGYIRERKTLLIRSLERNFEKKDKNEKGKYRG